MPVPDCRLLMSVAEDLFATDTDFQREIEDLLDTHADPLQIVDAMVARLPLDDAAVLLREAMELPTFIWHQMALHWRTARDAGRAYHLESVEPEDMMGAARRREVSLRVRMAQDSVTVSLAHIPGRHATWAAPTAIAS